MPECILKKVEYVTRKPANGTIRKISNNWHTTKDDFGFPDYAIEIWNLWQTPETPRRWGEQENMGKADFSYQLFQFIESSRADLKLRRLLDPQLCARTAQALFP